MIRAHESAIGLLDYLQPVMSTRTIALLAVRKKPWRRFLLIRPGVRS